MPLSLSLSALSASELNTFNRSVGADEDLDEDGLCQMMDFGTADPALGAKRVLDAAGLASYFEYALEADFGATLADLKMLSDSWAVDEAADPARRA